jgi:hypothetical protein
VPRYLANKKKYDNQKLARKITLGIDFYINNMMAF